MTTPLRKSLRRAALLAGAAMLAPVGALGQSATLAEPETTPAAAPSPASAAAAPRAMRLRGGEHDGYSRLVLSPAPGPGWRLIPGARGAELRLPAAPTRINLEDVNRRRTAHRVSRAALRRDGDAAVLALDFTCDCAVQAFALGDRMLVIDVRPRGAASDDPEPKRDAASASVPGAADETKTDQIESAREILLKQLKEAARQGIVAFKEPKGDPAAKPADGPPSEAEAKTAPDGAKTATASEPEAAPRTAANSEPGAETSAKSGAEPGSEPSAKPGSKGDAPTTPEADADPAKPPSSLARPATAPACLPDAAFAADAWIDDRPFFEGLAARREGLYDDLNKVDPKVVENLMRFYLGHGLGLEAGHMARAFRVETETAAHLGHLADAVAGRTPRDDSPLALRAPCPGRHALWQAAAWADHNIDAALAAFEVATDTLSLTPNPLRTLLGGRIGAAAARAGRLRLARDVLALLSRSGLPPTADMLWIEAELAFDDGRALAGRRALGEIVEKRGPRAPEALVRFGETLQAPLESALAERTADALADFALQYRGSEIGLRATIGEARLRARFRDLSGAVNAIELARERADAPSIARLQAGKRGLIADEIAKLEADPTSSAAIHAVRAIEHLKNDAAGDGLRIRLARTLIKMDAPKLVELVIDDAVANRATVAAKTRAEAREKTGVAAAIARGLAAGENDAQGKQEALGALSIGAPAAKVSGGTGSEPVDQTGAITPAAKAEADADAGTDPRGEPTADAKPKTETDAAAAAPTPRTPPKNAEALDPNRAPPSLGNAERLIEAVDDDLKRLKEMLSDG